jgi:thiamine-phosphate pyrophosphorylase
MMGKHKITGGIYLVLDPSMEKSSLYQKLRAALEGGVQLLQIWNNWPVDFDRDKKIELVSSLTGIAGQFSVPVLVNEEWELVEETNLSGVHFDEIPEDFARIKQRLQADSIFGVTCSNDLHVVEWADQHRLDYISFCAMFPSSSAGSCEIVTSETVQKARLLTDLPLFVSGGITPDNLCELRELDIAGVAVISGILSHEQPKEAALLYTNLLKELKNEKFIAK